MIIGEFRACRKLEDAVSPPQVYGCFGESCGGLGCAGSLRADAPALDVLRHEAVAVEGIGGRDGK